MDKSKMLAIAINKAIDEIDSNMAYDEFAYAVALVLYMEYGKLLGSSFISELQKYVDEMDKWVVKDYLKTEVWLQ